MSYNFPEYKRTLIRKNESVGPAIERLERVSIVGLDSETTGLNPRQNKIRLIQIAAPDLMQTYIFDLFHVTDVEHIVGFLLNPEIGKIGHNLTFDCQMTLSNLGAYIESPIDLMLAAQLLQVVDLTDKHRRGGNALVNLAKEYLDLDLDKTFQKSNWGQELTKDQLVYAARDVEILPDLAEKLCSKIDDAGMTDAFNTENAFIFPLSQMNLYGVKIGHHKVKALEAELDDKIALAERQCAKFIPNEQLNLFSHIEPVKLGSTKEVAAAIKRVFGVDVKKADKETGEMKTSVSADVLLLQLYAEDESQRLPREFVDAYCEYQTLKHSKDSTLTNLIKYSDATGRSYPEWFQLGQPQHRVSAKQPNMLSVPRKDTYGPDVAPNTSLRYSELSFRSIFIPEDGYDFVISDASQLQYRIITELSNEPYLIKVYKENIDQHAETGALIFDIPNKDIPVVVRMAGKSGNFAMLFKAGPKRLQDAMLSMYGIYKTLDEWKEFRDKYYRKRPVFANWQKRNIEMAEQHKIIQAAGRKVFISPNSPSFVQAVNFPAVLMEQQIVKRAAGLITRQCWKEKLHTRQILNVYDELVYETKQVDSQRVKTILQKEFLESLAKYITKIPVKADAAIGSDWGAKG